MAVNLPSPGAANWDVPLNNALGVLAHSGINPTDHSLIAWNFPLYYNQTALTPVSGTVYMFRLPRVTQAQTVTNIHLLRGSNPAVTPAAGQNFAGLYSVLGDRVAVTGDISTTLSAASGFRTLPLTAPYNMAPGFYYVAVVQNAATPTNLWASSNNTATIPNAGLTAANGLWTSGPTGQTSLPASITPGSRTLIAPTVWAGIS